MEYPELAQLRALLDLQSKRSLVEEDPEVVLSDPGLVDAYHRVRRAFDEIRGRYESQLEQLRTDPKNRRGKWVAFLAGRVSVELADTILDRIQVLPEITGGGESRLVKFCMDETTYQVKCTVGQPVRHKLEGDAKLFWELIEDEVMSEIEGWGSGLFN